MMKTKEDTELLDTMVDSLVADVVYQFNLDREDQALNIIKKSLERLEK